MSKAQAVVKAARKVVPKLDEVPIRHVDRLASAKTRQQTKNIIDDAVREHNIRAARTEALPEYRGSVAALPEAQQLVKMGATRTEVWQKTGWWQNSRGKWRFALNPEAAKFNDQTISRLAREKYDLGEVAEDGTVWVAGRAEEIFAYPELFETFPAVAGKPMRIKLKMVADGPEGPRFQITQKGESSGGSYDPTTGRISIHSTDGRSTAFHELEHSIADSRYGQAGSSQPRLERSVENFKIWSYLKRAMQKGDQQGFNEDDWRMLFGEDFRGLSDNEVDVLAKKAMRYQRGNFEKGEEITVDNLIKQFADESAAWLNEVGALDGTKAVEQQLKEIDPLYVSSLAETRYWNDAEEVEARVAQVMQNLTKEQILSLPEDPFSTFATLTPEKGKELLEQGLDIKPMKNPVGSLDEIIVGGEDATVRSQ